MGFTLWACRTTTGQNFGRLDATLTSWSRELNGADQAQISIAPGAVTATTRDGLRALTTGQLMSLVIDWNGVIVWAGPIIARQFTTGTLTLTAAGLTSILAARKAITQTPPFAAQTLTYTGVSLATIGRGLIQVATDMAKPGAALPIVLPPTESDTDTTHQRTYNGFDLSSVSDLIANLTGVIGGPDIDFMPQWTDGNRSAFQWVMRAGTKAQPQLSSMLPVAFDATQPGSSVQTIDVTEDYSHLATTMWAKGSGSGTSEIVSMAQSTTLTSQGYPALERETDYTTVTTQAELDAHTAGDLATFSTPTVQWALKVDGSATPALGSYFLGDTAKVNVRRHEWVPDGDYAMRILSIKGDGSNSQTLAMQPYQSRGIDLIGGTADSLPFKIAALQRGV
ncbi:MAG: hypothetical protein HIU88_10275 [Acidobacteria bacterium]|nr:hypothetical protein [Acidobacteriota bacterium]